MAITGGRSATSAQTISSSYEIAFDATSHTGGADLIEIECLTESIICKINGGTEFLVSAGQKVYRRAKSPGGIVKLEAKRGGASDATFVWDVDVIVGG